MLLRNARLTMGGTEPVDVAVSGGVITAIGAGLPTGQHSGPNSGPDSIDLEGQWLTPGLWDNHVHFTQWALLRQRLDVSAATSARAAAALVAGYLATPGAKDEPIVGVGFRDGLWADAPGIAELDAASGDVPVVLVSADLHAVWLNSAALARYGHRGHPTGLLQEDLAFEVVRRINTAPAARLDAWADDAARAAASRGVVGIVDLEMDWNLGTWSRRMAAGTDAIRVEFGIYPQHLDRAIAEGLVTGQSFGELLTVGRVKIITDGSLNTRTAYSYQEYPGLAGNRHSHGMLTVAPDELLALMRRATDAGLESTVHAIGDHANSLALDAFERVGSRGRIEHAQLLNDSDVARFAELGVVASVQPEHAMDDRDVAELHWPGLTGRSFAFRSLLDAGARLALGSDAPVSPLDPWVGIAAAVSRSRDGRESWHPEQSIGVAQAIEASVRSRVAEGEPADLVVTPVDPLAVTPEALRSMPVTATLLAGRFTHSTL